MVTVEAVMDGNCGPIAEVYAKTSEGMACGSAYHLGGGLLLTARHVVADHRGLRAGVLVRLLGSPQLLSCQIVWLGRSGLDLALVRVTEPKWVPPRTRRVRWGRFVTDRPGAPCAGEGFPDVQATTEQRDVEQFSGTINPRTTSKAGLLSISVKDPPPRVVASKSPWEGMSGAVVRCQGLITGVVVRDPAGFSSTRLVAFPLVAVANDQEFRRLVEQATGEELIFEPVELSGMFSRPEPIVSPAQLLRGEVQAFPFRGRDAQLKDLQRWCNEETQFSGWLLVGLGGQGKTRLAAHLASTIAKYDWGTGFVRYGPDSESISALSDANRPLLLVVDYAETRPEIIAKLTEAARDSANRVRVLLLARVAGDWMTGAAADHASLAWLTTVNVTELDALEPTPDGRVFAWKAAVKSLATRLTDIPSLAAHDWQALALTAIDHPPDWLTDNTRLAAETPILGIQMDALARLLALAYPTDIGGSAADTLLIHEQRYWRRAASALGLSIDDSIAYLITAVATLYGAADEAEGDAVLLATPGTRDQKEDRRATIGRWLASLYPSAGHYWGSLEPDRLAEHHIAATLKRRPDLMVCTAATVSASQAEHALTVLTRAAADHPNVAPAIDAAVSTRPQTFGPAAVRVAQQAAQPAPLLSALTKLASERSDDKEILELLFSELPDKSPTLSLQAAKIVKYLIIIYDRLSVKNPEENLPRLAQYLRLLSRYLNYMGHVPAAEKILSLALDVCFQLHSDNSEVLALTASDWSMLLAGKHGQEAKELAVEYAKIAVTERRKLQSLHDERYTQSFAQSLNWLTSTLIDLNRSSEALEVSAEALAVLRALSRMAPDAYSEDLAECLTWRALAHAHLGQRREALAFKKEILDITLQHSEPLLDTQMSNLAGRLMKIAKLFMICDQKPLAAQVGQESISIYRKLIAHDRYKHSPDLAAGLHNYSALLGEIGKYEEALEAVTEALTIRRSLAMVNPHAFIALVADSLSLQASHLKKLGRDNEFSIAVREIGWMTTNIVLRRKRLGWYGDEDEGVDLEDKDEDLFENLKGVDASKVRDIREYMNRFKTLHSYDVSQLTELANLSLLSVHS